MERGIIKCFVCRLTFFSQFRAKYILLDVKKSRLYIPNSRHNPERQARKLEKLSRDIENHVRELESVTKSYDRHMEYLSNFAKHDMGNAIQTMYATLLLAEDNFNEEHLKSLKTCVDNLQHTLNCFEKLVPYTKTGDFEISRLMISLETMTRSSIGLNGIEVRFLYDRSKRVDISQPYQALLQLLHNLVINSIKSFNENETFARKIIEIEAECDSDHCHIYVRDTGSGIADEHIGKIFDYQFTTTNGSGIGLYHAKYVCKKINGEITVERNVQNFSTVFKLKFPINGNKENSNN